jgi:membrane protease YdiL (CAAX protease family)
MIHVESPRWTPALWAVAALILLPFPLKNILLIGEPDYGVWLCLDYLARFISMAGVWLAYRWDVLKPLGGKAGWLATTEALAVLLACQFVLYFAIDPIVRSFLPTFELSRSPEIPGGLLRTFDLWMGLLLVAVSEELAFRHFLFSVLSSTMQSERAAVVASAAAFGAIHFLGGPAHMLTAFMYGILVGIAFARTRRLWICVAAHYVLNLVIWSTWWD